MGPWHTALAMLALLAISCAGTRSPTVPAGATAIVTTDGLYRVEDARLGALYMKPGYVFGSHPKVLIGETSVAFKPGGRVLSEEEVADLTAHLDDLVRDVLRQFDRTEVLEPGPCVSLLSLSVVDLDLLDPRNLPGGARTTVISSYGAATLVIDVRASQTGEPLMRYARRRALKGGLGVGVTERSEMAALAYAFRRFSRNGLRDFEEALPEQAPPDSVECDEEAGAGPVFSAPDPAASA